VTVAGFTLDNGLLRVTVSPAGAVEVEHLASTRTLNSVLAFEHHVEAGDLYTPAPRGALPAPRLRRISVTARGPLRGEITLRFTTGDGALGRGSCRLRLQLDAGLDALRVNVDGVNRDGDHRLRLRFDSGLADASTVADAAFTSVQREPLSVPPEDQRDEQVVRTAPLHRWVARFGAHAGCTIFSDGLAEYESADDGAVLVTLFRAVGQLSRADLPERPGHAGWPAPTPGAQSIGPWNASFAFAMHGADDWQTRQRIEQWADDVLLPLRGGTLRYSSPAQHPAGGLELHGDGLRFGAACPAQEAPWITLRCVNTRDVPVRGRWTLARPISAAVRARLDETPQGDLAIAGGGVDFDAAPGEIVTILVK